MLKTHRFISPLLLALATCGTAIAGDGKQVVDSLVEADQASLCDFFDLATLYSNKENPILQKFALSGRLQADAAFFDASQAASSEQLLWRRFRSGFKATMFKDFTVHAEADLDLNEHNPLYNKLTDTYISWSRGDEFELLIGKQGAKYTMDGATSSKELIRMERSLLSNNLWFTEEYFTGVSATGEVDKWVYNLGFFSSDGGAEFGDFQAGYFGLVSIGYDFAETFGLDKALIRGDYVNNDPTGDGILNTRPLTQVGSINGTFEKGPWGLRTDIGAGEGWKDQSDLFAIAIMPYFNLSDKVQLVASYNYVTSSGENGVRLDRYESSVVSGRADEAHEFYAGVNYYLCKHKLKWQTGVEYTTASDSANDGGAYDGWGVSSGIRISW
jgi:phosphate-selective porin OprO/OprP